VPTADEAPGRGAGAPPLVILHVMKTGGFSLLYQVTDNVQPGARWGPPTEGMDELERMARYASVEQLRALDPAERSRLEVVMGHFPFAVVELAGLDHADIATVVRDPVDRVVSYLKMCKSTNDEHRDLPLEQIYEDSFFGPRTIRNHQTKMLGMSAAQASAAPPVPEDPPNPEIVAALIADGYFDSEEFASEVRGARFLAQMLDTPHMWPVPVDRTTLDAARRNLERVDILGVHDRYDDFLQRLAARTGWTINPEIRANQGSSATVSASFRRRIEDGNQLDLELYDHARSLLDGG
jgi:hypothetical protein